jgi:hypothetical protein
VANPAASRRYQHTARDRDRATAPVWTSSSRVSRKATRDAGLQQHHARHDPRRDGRLSPRRVAIEVGEVVVREQGLPVVREQAIDRSFPESVTEDSRGFSKRCWTGERSSAMG